MGYERNDRRYGRDQGFGRAYSQDQDYDRGYGRDRFEGRSAYDRGPDAGRGYGSASGYDRDRGFARNERDYGRQPQGYDYEDRGFFDRAGDEVRSWFGDEDAERRRQMDERYYDSNDNRSGPNSAYGESYGSSGGRYGTTGAGAGFGANQNYGAGRRNDPSFARSTGGRERQDWGHDPNYRSWRDRQIATFDQDYDEYRREHQSKFDTEFHSWRTNRQGQRGNLSKVQEHQEVVGADGAHVGKVDKVRGDRVILTKSDQDAGGHHHSFPSSWIKEVSDKVMLTKTAEEAHSHWRDEERNSATGWNRDQGEDRIGKDHNLDRSFSGTY